MLNNSVFSPDALANRVAVVTGASGGLGDAIAAKLHAMGAVVIAVDRSAPVKTKPWPSLECDISAEEQVENLASTVAERWGSCDILVNNAGIMPALAPLEDLPVKDWDAVIDVNLRGTFLCSKYLGRQMLKRGSGAIVSLSSITATVPNDVGPYGASKSGIRGLTRQMAVEWGPRGVRANSISPGMIRTPLAEEYYRNEKLYNHRISSIPSRRVGHPDDVSNTVAFLVSDGASYINGQDIVVDGGFTLNAMQNVLPKAITDQVAHQT